MTAQSQMANQYNQSTSKKSEPVFMVCQFTDDQVFKQVLIKYSELLLELKRPLVDYINILQHLTCRLEHCFTTHDGSGQVPRKQAAKFTSVTKITGSVTHLENCQKCMILMKKRDLFKHDFWCRTALPHMSNQMPFLNPEDIFSTTYIILLSSSHRTKLKTASC